MTWWFPVLHVANSFQLTSSRRGWQHKRKQFNKYNNFNSHPHEEDDVSAPIVRVTYWVFQLTSSRRGWLLCVRLFLSAYTISTHILTKRMTWMNDFIWSRIRYFNSHPHEEDDNEDLKVSDCVEYFNSHPHEEDDGTRIPITIPIKYFNSHPHEEDDGNMKVFPVSSKHFNSHPHEEDDSNFKQK